MSTQTLGDVIINMRAVDVNMSAGFNSIGKTLGDLSNKIFSFQGLLKVGFGAQVGRKIFTEMHEGAIHFAEGLHEATVAGEGLGDSLTDAARKAIGLETSSERVAKHWKEAAEHAAQIGKLTGFEDGKQTPAGQQLADAQKIVAELDKKAAPGRSEINRLQTMISEQDRDNFTGHNVLIDDMLAAAKKKYADDISAADQAQVRLTAIQDKIANDARIQHGADLVNQKNQDDREQRAKGLFDAIKTGGSLLTGGQAPGGLTDLFTSLGVKLGNQTGESFVDSMKQKVLGVVGAAAGAEGGLFDKIFGGAAHAVLGGGEALGKRRMEEEDRLNDLKHAERQSPRFMSLEQLARSVQESQGKSAKDEAAAKLNETNQILRRIEEKKFIAGMA